jgi:hypothetical protein
MKQLFELKPGDKFFFSEDGQAFENAHYTVVKHFGSKTTLCITPSGRKNYYENYYKVEMYVETSLAQTV